MITELIQTEKDYCHAMQVTVRVFEKRDQEAERIQFNIEKVFSDMKSVIHASRQLLKLLDNYAFNRPYEDQKVGVCFLELSAEIKQAYTQYCRNHGAIIAQLKLYEGKSASYLRKFLFIF